MAVAIDLEERSSRRSSSTGGSAQQTVLRTCAKGSVKTALAPGSLPDLGGILAPWWKLVPRRYGHVLHSMCSYMGMFPPSIPRYFIEQYTQPGDLVVDPFSGRGTTALEANLLGRASIGVDLNPLAALLTSAKVDPPSKADCLARLRELEKSYAKKKVKEKPPPEIAMLFDGRKTLPQLAFLREQLDMHSSREDRFLLATITGILHGNHPRNPWESRCLSVSMPNTFSMSPGYLRKFIKEKKLKKYPFDAFEKIAARIEHLYHQGVAPTRGRGIHDDALALDRHVAKGSVKLIVTSPPYLNVVRYGKFNWIRLWMLRESVQRVDDSLSDRTRTHLEVERTDRQLGLSDRLGFRKYTTFLRDALCKMAEVLTNDGVCVITIGDVENGEYDKRLGLDVWAAIEKDVPLKLQGVITDRLVTEHKVSRIWGEHKGRATRVDRVLVLTKSERMPRANFPDPRDIVARMAREAPGAIRALPEQE
jgi:site-specific DNA-methyltransferase (adenine-specific)